MNNDEQKIRKLIADWMRFTEAGELDRVLALMTEDIVFLVPHNAPFGKQKFAEFAQHTKNAKFEGKSDIQEVIVSGDWAFVRSHLTVSVTSPIGSRARRSGPVMSIFQKQKDGEWLLARDCNLLTLET